MRKSGSVSGLSAGSAVGMISTIVADDEQLARDELTFLLGQFEDIEVIATASNGLEAFDLIEKLEPDLVFLDIQMPGLDGLAVVRKLRESQIEIPHVIFSTAWDQFAVEAFRLEVTDYVLKPVEKDRLAASLSRVRKSLSERAHEPRGAETISKSTLAARIVVRSGTRNLVIDPQDLIYATISGGVITVVADSAEGQSSFRTLEELLAALDPQTFWRAHRSWVVNLTKIREVSPWFKSTYQLKMNDKKATHVPVSRAQSRRLREMLNL